MHAQVLYSMASELGQFLVVMTVVLLGFSLSFFALFKEIKGATFRASLLDAFQAMLGETDCVLLARAPLFTRSTLIPFVDVPRNVSATYVRCKY